LYKCFIFYKEILLIDNKNIKGESMTSLDELFEQQLRRQAATSSAVERRNWALQRIQDLKDAFAAGRVDSKTYQARLKYWMKVAAGAAASPVAAAQGEGPSINDLKTIGTFF